MRNALACAALLLAGCVFGTETLTLPRGPQGVAVTGGEGRRVVVVSPFLDRRAIKHRCGMKKNTYNLDTADLVCSGDPGRWIAEFLAEELERAGFEVILGGDVVVERGVYLAGSLVHLFVEPVIGFATVSGEADLHVELEARSANGLVAKRSFFAKTRRSSALAGTRGLYQDALDDASRQLAKEMVAAIVSLFNRFPQVSAVEGVRVFLRVDEAREPLG